LGRGASESGGASEIALRPALLSDVPVIERLVDIASSGLARYVLSAAAAPAEKPREASIRVISGDQGFLSWRCTTLAEVGGVVAGMMMTSRIAEAWDAPIDPPAVLRPQAGLRARAIGAQHVTFLATLARFRGRGIGWALLTHAERLADGAVGLSLIVADPNPPARRLYDRFGFHETARVPAVKEGWRSPTTSWVLMLKPAAAA
jgi:ribosomal protein S18 acetylase RimI-like enzyme